MSEKREKIRSSEEAREFLLSPISLEDLEPDSSASDPKTPEISPTIPKTASEILFDPARHPDYRKQQLALRLEEGPDFPRQKSRPYLF